MWFHVSSRLTPFCVIGASAHDMFRFYKMNVHVQVLLYNLNICNLRTSFPCTFSQILTIVLTHSNLHTYMYNVDKCIRVVLRTLHCSLDHDVYITRNNNVVLFENSVTLSMQPMDFFEYV